MRNGLKTKLLVGATAGAMMLSVAGPAMAQPTQANETAQVNQGNLISALNNVNAEINNVEALNNLTVNDVQVVNVEDSVNNNNVLNNALRNADIDALQDFLDGNEVIKDSLNQNDVAIGDVVAVDVLSDGTVVVFEE